MSEARKPFLTITIPVFNGETLLAPMLASLEAQDWSLFEVLFGDDGSTDGTRGVLDAFAAKHPGRVSVESHENIGAGATRNRLAKEAQGDWIWFCDADDEIAPGGIARIAEILLEHPVDFLSLCYGAKPDDSAKSRLDLPPVEVSPFELVLSMPCATSAKVLRTSLLRDGGIEFPSTNVGEDLVQSIRAACNSRSALFWYAKPYWVRRRPDSASGRVDEGFCASLAQSLALVDGLKDEFPAFGKAIEVQQLLFWHYFLRRLRDDASPEIRKKWIPFVKKALAELSAANDNPLLRIPRAFARSEGLALKREDEARKREDEARKREDEARKREDEARKREDEARKREDEARKREDEARKSAAAAVRREQALRASFSWRVTAPLRTVAGWFGRQK